MKDEVRTLLEGISSEIEACLRSLPPPEGVVYACGFWLFYCDYTLLGTPCFAYNTVGNENDAKWSPPEWTVDVEDQMVAALSPIYEDISRLMENESDDAWEELINGQWIFYCQLCQKINQALGTDASPLRHWNLSEDFVIGIFEERESEELYRYLVNESVGEQEAKSLGII